MQILQQFNMKAGERLYHSRKIKSYLARRQHKFLCLERATIAEWQGASEDQKCVAKPTQSNMALFFVNGIIRDLEYWNLDAVIAVGYRVNSHVVFLIFRNSKDADNYMEELK